MFSISFVVSDILGNFNIFSTRKCLFQQSLSDESRENGKKQNFWPLISLIIGKGGHLN